MGKKEGLARLLSFDCLAEAERMTGKSYKENEAVVGLGMALNMDVSKQKEQILKSSFDTTFDSKLSYYLEVMSDLGFQEAYHREFQGSCEKPDHHYVMFQPELGILLNFDTYFGDSVNGGKYYYNLEANRDPEGKIISIPFQTTSSGCMRDGIWAGDHDCREAVRFKINRLKLHGTFLKSWKKKPYISLTNYMDWNKKGSDYKSEDVFSKLPLNVQKAITPEEEN